MPVGNPPDEGEAVVLDMEVPNGKRKIMDRNYGDVTFCYES